MATPPREGSLQLVNFEKETNAEAKGKAKEGGEDVVGYMSLLHGQEIIMAEEFNRKMAEQRRKATERQRRYRAKRRESLLEASGGSGSILLTQADLERRRKDTERQRRHRAKKKAELEAAKKILEAQETLSHFQAQGIKVQLSIDNGGKLRNLSEVVAEGGNQSEHDGLLEGGSSLMQGHRRPRGQLVLPHQALLGFRREDIESSHQHNSFEQ